MSYLQEELGFAGGLHDGPPVDPWAHTQDQSPGIIDTFLGGVKALFGGTPTPPTGISPITGLPVPAQPGTSPITGLPFSSIPPSGAVPPRPPASSSSLPAILLVAGLGLGAVLLLRPKANPSRRRHRRRHRRGRR